MSERQRGFVRTWSPILAWLIGLLIAYRTFVSTGAEIIADLKSNDVRLFERTTNNDERITVLERQAIDQGNRLIEMQGDLKYLVKAQQLDERRNRP